MRILSACRQDPVGVFLGAGIIGGLSWLALPLILGAMLLLAGCALAPDFPGARDAAVKVANGYGHGSGTVISPDTILTAAHVVQDGETLDVEFADGRTAKATVIWRDEVSDAALMKLAVPEKHWASVDCKPLKMGDRVFTFGNPGFLRFVLTDGIVSGIETMGMQKASLPQGMPVEIEPMIVVSADWEPGDSGAAVFDQKGRVRGLVSIVFGTDRGGVSNNGLITPVTVLPMCKGRAA